METLPAWVTEAARLPVAFAQVREDPLLDLWVVEQFGASPGRVILVASGGCTAALLAASGRVSHLHLVDLNPSQIALARLKLALVKRPTAERLALVGHAPLRAADRWAALTDILGSLGLAPDILGPAELVAEAGPDYAGRYERAFARLRDELLPVADDLEAVLRHPDSTERARRLRADKPLGRAFDEAYDRVLSLPNLVKLFGEGATQNRVESFASHFARRTRHAVASLPTADNPYLWQMLFGRFPSGVAYPWLTAPAASHLPEVTFACRSMTEALAASPGAFDFVHLSNILDWLSPEEAAATLDLAAAALRPGGWVLVRQLNSTVDVPASGRGFTWLEETAAELHARDRSFFYRALHLGRK
jgi:S-adenosylmethionine-diacylglycerol 3-amino-3-carboxypropyl transferase